jgi:di/tricarboxylate transporter
MNAMEQSTYPDEKIGLLEQTIKRDEAVMVHRKRPRFIVGLAVVLLLLCWSFNLWGQLVASHVPSHDAQEKDVDFADVRVPPECLPCNQMLTLFRLSQVRS